MPELPEVETTVRGISPLVTGNRITDLVVREHRLRWPIPDSLSSHILGKRVLGVSRRAKYILVEFEHGHMLMHLGMSGSLRFALKDEPLKLHDHVEFEIGGERQLRFHDPRRFGCVLWIDGDPAEHHLLNNLGPEPLTADFNAKYLFEQSRKRKVAVKHFIMDSHVVVGVGNIYASEALFRARIRPGTRASRIFTPGYQQLVTGIQETMKAALDAGGTTLRDYVNGSGSPGYFAQELLVYEREGEACRTCSTSIRRMVMGQRSTYYCPSCQG